VTSNFAAEHAIELDKRDVEQEAPYNELLALGGDANLIPYLYDDGQLIQGNDAIIAHLTAKFLQA
jgi:glutaredoxin